MEIRKKVINKYLKEYWQDRVVLRKQDPGRCGQYLILGTETGKIIGRLLENKQGWYALVCFYDNQEPLVDVYDRHVFDRYSHRFLRNKGEGDREEVIRKFVGSGNCSGTVVLESTGEFSKRIKDGACFGNIKDDIIYHKTYMTDDMLVGNNREYLLDL
jgi:hypothetical protein